MGECVISIMCKICVYILRKHLTLTTCMAYRIFVVVLRHKKCVCVCVCVYESIMCMHIRVIGTRRK